MFGKSVKRIVTLLVIIVLYQCMALHSIQPDEMVQSSSDAPGVPNRGDFTYQASLRTSWNYHYCAGAIISDRWVLTSSSCVIFNFFDFYEVFAIVGGLDIYEGDSYPCDLVKKNELFQPGQFENDMALMRTSSPILFNQFVQPIPYYKGSIESDISAVLIGWGQMNWLDGSTAHPITYTNVTVFSKTECASIWQDTYQPSLFPSTAICGSYLSSRNIEFGVPLATSDSRVLLGIYADAYSHDNSRPSLYTGTADVANWIFQNTNVDGVDNRFTCSCTCK